MERRPAGVLVDLAHEQYENGNLRQVHATTVNKAMRDESRRTPRCNPIAPSSRSSRASLSWPSKDLQPAPQWLDPKNAEADYLCGVVYQRWQKPEVAYEFYRQASSKAPAELAYVLARAKCSSQWTVRTSAEHAPGQSPIPSSTAPEIRDAVGQLLMQQGQ